jgi:Eukaryotic translation initiation factor eIF2A
MQGLRLIALSLVLIATGCRNSAPEFSTPDAKNQSFALVEGFVFEVNHYDQAFQLAIKNNSLSIKQLTSAQYIDSAENCGRYKDNVDVPLIGTMKRNWSMSRALDGNAKTIAAVTEPALRTPNEDYVQEIYIFKENNAPLAVKLPKNNYVSCILWNQKSQVLLVIHGETRGDISSVKHFFAKVIGHGSSVSNFQMTVYSMEGKLLLNLPLMKGVANDWQRAKIN